MILFILEVGGLANYCFDEITISNDKGEETGT
jgi:hypothetical protein